MTTSDRGAVADSDALLRLLAHGDRRVVLRTVAARPEGTVSLDALVRRVAAARTRTGVDEDRVRLSLHHRHLPMLDDGGLLSYDRDAHVVRCPSLDRLEAALSVVPADLDDDSGRVGDAANAHRDVGT